MNSELYDKYKYKKMFYYLFFVLFFATFLPLSTSIVLLALSPFVRVKYVLELGIILLVYSYFLINMNKEIINDLVWYSQHYIEFTNVNFDDIFGVYRYGVPAKITEPLYHLFSYALSNITNGNYTVYVFVITTSIYIGSLVAIFIFLKDTKFSHSKKALLVIFVVFFCIIFTQSLHLIRQYLACTILLYGITFLSKERLKLALLMFVLAGLTHNSTIIVSILFSCTYILFRIFNSKLTRFNMSIILGVGFAFLYIFAFYYIGKIELLNINDGSVSLIVKLIDIALFASSTIVYLKMRNVEREVDLIYCLVVSFCTFLLVLHLSVYLSLRYYFYLDFLRWISVFILLRYYVFEKKTLVMFSSIIVTCGVIYLALRISQSPFSYGYTLPEYLTYPLNKLFSPL